MGKVWFCRLTRCSRGMRVKHQITGKQCTDAQSTSSPALFTKWITLCHHLRFQISSYGSCQQQFISTKRHIGNLFQNIIDWLIRMIKVKGDQQSRSSNFYETCLLHEWMGRGGLFWMFSCCHHIPCTCTCILSYQVHINTCTSFPRLPLKIYLVMERSQKYSTAGALT